MHVCERRLVLQPADFLTGTEHVTERRIEAGHNARQPACRAIRAEAGTGVQHVASAR